MMFKIPQQEYTPEFKDLAVKRVKSGQGIAAVAKDLGLVEQTLRNWVKAAKAGKLNPPGAKAVTPEQMELSRLRAENARLRLECEILKKATAYFAKDVL
jgi:transposase